jgi:hypothetical protein
MKQLEALQEYLTTLYDAYEAFQTDYKRLHKRSKMHNRETVAEYYLRWRDNMRNEISRIEMVLMKRMAETKLTVKNSELNVENNQLQIVA